MSSQFHHTIPPNMGHMHDRHYAHDHYDEEHHSEPPPSYAATLESVSLGTDEENRQLLDQIDQLRECRVDQYIDLPQIVVIGDQSTGKSSVLEAITNIPFPRSSVKCTKFATQIRLRRADNVETTISILPGEGCSPEERNRLSTFSQTIQDQADFNTIFRLAEDAIFPPGMAHSFLSKNILSIEISGQSQPHLTVVDLPGIIHAPTMEQTEEDIKAINSLAISYMQKERTIILIVVSGSNDISNQVVLKRAKKLDPKGTRTLGIITKPDMALTDKQRLEFIKLASNEDNKNRLQLGWHVLRNRAHDEMHLSMEERKGLESNFFANSIWGARLRANQLGVDHLKKRLSTQLIRHIATEVFKVQTDIERELENCRSKLSQMGKGHDTVEEMTAELFRLCERSRGITHAAVLGHQIPPTGEEDFFPSFDDGKNYSRNFRSRVVKQNGAFASYMESWGSDCIIIEGEGARKAKPQPSQGGTAIVQISRNDYIHNVVYPLLRDNPGQELSMDSNPLLVFRLFQSYSKHWPSHATHHIKIIHKLCEEFLNQVLLFVWPQQIRSRVWVYFIKSKVDTMLAESLRELERLKTDRMKQVTPYESDFIIEYYRLRESDPSPRNASELSDQRYEDVLRKMLLLYKSNLKTFVTNVIVQVVERHIADGLEEVFHDKRVRNLNDTEIKRMLEDDYDVRIARRELKEQEAILSKGLEICAQIGLRSDLGPYENPNLYSQSSDEPNPFPPQEIPYQEPPQRPMESNTTPPRGQGVTSTTSSISSGSGLASDPMRIPSVSTSDYASSSKQYNIKQSEYRKPVPNMPEFTQAPSSSQAYSYSGNGQYSRNPQVSQQFQPSSGSTTYLPNSQ